MDALTRHKPARPVPRSCVIADVDNHPIPRLRLLLSTISSLTDRGVANSHWRLKRTTDAEADASCLSTLALPRKAPAQGHVAAPSQAGEPQSYGMSLVRLWPKARPDPLRLPADRPGRRQEAIRGLSRQPSSRRPPAACRESRLGPD
ncbi:hypothetical protein CDD83_7136 [Cordyceps sp. RAO-2017]|nr:hypothetical protein CDD83_7136 [Cordyceps sp. RAO-2017]